MPVATRWPLVGRRDELDLFTLALDDSGCQAVCIYGPSGVGKTRLGEECLAVADAAGRRVLRVTAAPLEGVVVPLAAVAHLLPARALAEWQEGDDAGSIARARMLRSAVETLAPTGAESGPPVLLVDDAHRLDRSSLAVVDHLLAHGAVFGVATVNSGEPVPDAVTQWWREERATRIDLGGLDPVGIDTLLHVALQGALDGSASADLWRASQGNLLVLHELVLGALAEESLVERDGVWYLNGPLHAPARLGDIVERRVGRSAGAGRAVLEILALCQPVSLHQLESSFEFAVLEELERDGLIAVRTDGRRQRVSLAHPLHGEVLRAELSPARTREILLRHAEELERFGARRRDDPVRIATLRLEATGQADPELLLRAARVARFDNDLTSAARLATAAVAVDPTATGALVLGDALYNLGSFEEAETVLAGGMERATEALAVSIATLRLRNLFFGCRRDDEAVAVGKRAASQATSESARAELEAVEAELLAYSGRPLDALAAVDRLETGGPRQRVLASIPRAAALAMTGSTAEALSLSRRAVDGRTGLLDELAVPTPGAHRVTELFALVQAGRLLEADQRGRASFELALHAGMPLEVLWLSIHLARGALARGLPSTALGWAERASNAINAHRVDGLRPIAAAIQAAAYGLRGDAAASMAAANGVMRQSSGFGAFAFEVPLGRAWALVAAGDLRSAREVLISAAASAERSGFVVSAGWLLHDAARLGAAEVVEARLAALAGASDSDLLRLRAEHVAALVASDGRRLAALSDEFTALGVILPAAEAAAQGAEAWRGHGDESRAAALDLRADTLVARCEGARTPVLVRARAVLALSERERHVAVLAAQGHSSRTIATHLSLSVRTVDNHLGRIYSKLGVSNRAELAAALAPEWREDGPT
jgi:DNA-binding CsgD family transcriptional regulator